MIHALQTGVYDDVLSCLYALDGIQASLDRARDRAIREAQALRTGDFPRFLALVNASGLSSSLHLQNTYSATDPRQQAIPLALALGRELLEGTGAIRVHGGGFAGTIQAFVPQEKLKSFKTGMEGPLGPGKCHVLHIRPQGGCVVID